MIPPAPATADGLFHLAAVAMRKYSREPATREHSARLLMAAAIHLFAAETSAGEAALNVGEVVGDLGRIERLNRQAPAVASVSGERG